MKMIDAVWEKRNLGVDVTEIQAEPTDSAEELVRVLSGVHVPYSVVKIPANCPALLLAAQDCGYKVIETGMTIEGNIKRVATPKLFSRFLPFVEIREADSETLEKIFAEVSAGEIFATDRIALDPAFSKELAGRRYYNWCLDVMKQGAMMEAACYKGQPVAFNLSILKQERGLSDGLIGGVFSEAKNMGLGFLVVELEMDLCRKLGGKICLGRVSSNNAAILRLHMQYGFEIRDIQYVLIRHQ